MLKVVGIRFKKAGKIYYFDPVDTGVEVGDHVIVETVRGLEYGTVVIGAREVEENKLVSQLKPVMRKATEQDALKVQENKVREKEAFNICLRKIAKHGLPMRLIDVEFTFDVNKIIFYFTADGRIDFRELVKDLASVFRTRIELRQIGVRDEAKMLGGIGSCGRPLCCATFLGDFEPVSIRMAKDQNLSLNPAKISGVCGRLMCCLKYENDVYCSGCCGKRPAPERVEAPKVGVMVVTPLGEGRVMGVNRAMRTASVQLTPDNTIQVDIRPEDIEMQVYRSSGAGGQHINKTSSAVRLIHKPTGVVVSCQTQRSQFQNRDYAMEMLKAKLYQIAKQQHMDKIDDIKGVQNEIAWGHQIRSYVFMPYTLVKDHRTGYEAGNINAVMDGDLDGFINAYLKMELLEKLEKKN